MVGAVFFDLCRGLLQVELSSCAYEQCAPLIFPDATILLVGDAG